MSNQERLPHKEKRRLLLAGLGVACYRLVSERTILVLMVLFCIAMLGSIWHLHRLYHDLLESTALQDASRYTEALKELRTLYSSEVVETVIEQGIAVTDDYQEVEGAIPLPATFSMLLGNHMSQKGTGGQTRLYSPYPFPTRAQNGGLRDKFAQEAWIFLNQSPEQPFYSFEPFEGRPSLRYATADLMRPSCVNCHNTHPETPKDGWKAGDVRGVLEVISPLETAVAETRQRLQSGFLLILLVGASGVSSLAIAINRLRRSRDQLNARVRRRTAALATANAELETEVAERKQTERTLKKASVELARSNSELEQFAYAASHDLQQPLRTVSGFCQLLKRRYHGQFDTDADEFLDHAVDGATRMQELINALLDYSRVTTRANSFAATDCGIVVDHILADLEWAIEEADAVVTRDALPTLAADAAQIGQLFQNLIDNGIKFHGDESPRIHVSVERKGEYWVFSVQDNGIGIAPKHAERIFAVFQRLHGPAEYPGSGIGLAICKKIVERHQGRIWMESELGKGTTFYFTLPAVGKSDHDHKDRKESEQESPQQAD